MSGQHERRLRELERRAAVRAVAIGTRQRVVVVGDEHELAGLGVLPAHVVVVITGVPRCHRNF